MLTRNIVAAVSCATFAILASQSAAGATLTTDEMGEMPDLIVGQQQDPAAKPTPEKPAVTAAEGEKRAEKMQVEAPPMPTPSAPPPAVMPGLSPVPSPGPAPIQPEAQQPMSIEDRRAFYEQRYQDLRARARDAGVDMPAQPPWAGRGKGRQFMTDEERAAHREAMRNMSTDERQTYRREMHERMRERAWEEGVVLPPTPPMEGAAEQWQAPPSRPAWVDKMAEYRERVNRLSPEDRAACQALTRMEMRERVHRAMREMSARMQRMPEYLPRQFPQGVFGEGYPYAPEGTHGYDYPTAPGPGYGTGYQSPWGAPGAGYGSGPMAPFEDYGSGYPGAPGPGYGSPWGYER